MDCKNIGHSSGMPTGPHGESSSEATIGETQLGPTSRTLERMNCFKSNSKVISGKLLDRYEFLCIEMSVLFKDYLKVFLFNLLFV